MIHTIQRFFIYLAIALTLVGLPAIVIYGGWRLCDSLGIIWPVSLILPCLAFSLVWLAFFWWIAHIQKKERKVVGTFTHSYFGRVKQIKCNWETTMDLPVIGCIEVSSYEGTTPTEAQESTVEWGRRKV